MTHNTPLNVLPQRDGRSAPPLLLGQILPPAGSEGLRPARSLYIHVPFCFHKCHYCDFYSIVDTQDRQEAFTDRLIRELRALAPYSAGQPLQTIFVGGGTPSLLRVPLWERILTCLSQAFDLSAIQATAASPPSGVPWPDSLPEFTVECNPETVTGELMDTLRAGGVTRVSMGAQSFDARHLKTLERWHDPENVPRALELARAAGIRRQSIDLIFGVPGQTLADWESDLARGLSLGTEHLSCYSLTYEPQTAMTARLKRGEFTPADEDVEVEMHHAAWRAVRSAGMDRYEVSNFARPGAQCRHNLAYWRQESWLAAGPSASGHLLSADGVSGYRWKNIPRLDDYLTRTDASGTACLADHELPDPARALREVIMTGLRLSEGLDAHTLLARADSLTPGAGERLAASAKSMAARGLLFPDHNRWRLTDQGILFADGLAVEMFETLD